MKRSIIFSICNYLVFSLLVSAPLVSHSQFTKLGEFESGNFFGPYFFDEDGHPNYYDSDRVAGTTTLYDFSRQQVLTINPSPSATEPAIVSKVIPLKELESLNGGQDFYIEYTYSGNRRGSCVFRGSTGDVVQFSGFTDLVETNEGVRYIINRNSSSGSITTDFLLPPTLTVVGQISGRALQLDASGGRAMFVEEDETLLRYDETFSSRYIFDYSQQEYLSVRPLPKSTLNDSRERFIVANADTVNGERFTNIQIVDSSFQVFYDTTYAGGFAAIQLRKYEDTDLIGIVVLGGDGLKVTLSASTLQLFDVPELTGQFAYLPSGRFLTSTFNSSSRVDFYDTTTGDSVWAIPRFINYEGKQYNYSGGIAFGEQDAYSGAWFQYFNNTNRLVTDQFANPLDTVSYVSANSSPTFYPIAYDGDYYLFTRDPGDLTTVWNYSFYRYRNSVVSTEGPTVFLDLKLVPNPATASFTLRGEQLIDGVLTVKIYDTLGRLVQEQEGVRMNEPIALSTANGLYSVTVSQQQKVVGALPLLVTGR